MSRLVVMLVALAALSGCTVTTSVGDWLGLSGARSTLLPPNDRLGVEETR